MDARYLNPVNRDVPLARNGEFVPLAVREIRAWPPVVLAPMAGVTNPPFRLLCRSFGAGLYVSEMITARALVEGNRKTQLMASFDPAEPVRSLQLYGVDPRHVGEATRILVGEGRIDHLDLNFGCPAPKVTRRGGGAALPAKPRLLRDIIRAAVGSAGAVPVTIKIRIGIDDARVTFLEAGRIAQEEGCAAVGLHARTAAQHYSGHARWEAIARLKQALPRIPVLGNGDVWEAQDALRMMRDTGCDGVIVGRGCLGRPWLFRDLADVFEGRAPADPPALGEVVRIMLDHARRLVSWSEEAGGMRSFRKHASWYTKGFPGSAVLRDRLMRVVSLADLENTLATVDRDLPFPPEAMRLRRGKSGGVQKVVLPAGFLDDLDAGAPDVAGGRAAKG
ncbi:MAG: tRNA dihydrouridine synthase DusB [Vicinamibacteria bacterium]|nr:tRNA dihydrouridine synthase DusB [Vicinamibacteria bacterium]